MCYSLDNSRKFWNPDSKFTVTDHQQALYQINSIMDDDQLGPKTVAMENGVYIISMSPNSHWVLQRSQYWNPCLSNFPASRGGQLLPLGYTGMFPWQSEASADIRDLIYKGKKGGLVAFFRSCVVKISPTEFLLMGGNNRGLSPLEVEGRSSHNLFFWLAFCIKKSQNLHGGQTIDPSSGRIRIVLFRFSWNGSR